MSLLFALLLAAPDWFRAVQYTQKPVTLRGCSECRGEPDDTCPVRSGLQQEGLDEYAQGRWPEPGRLKLLRSKADPQCAVRAKAALGALELVAVRLAAGMPSKALLEKARAAVHGWPRAPRKRAAADRPKAAEPAQARLREALVCWPSDSGWPARAGLDASNACEFWLLAVKPETGEPDIAGASFPLSSAGAFAFGDARFAPAFDRAAPFDESALRTAPLGSSRPPEASSNGSPAPAPAPRGVEPATASLAAGADRDLHQQGRAGPARCGAAAAARTGTLDRFDQWEARVCGAAPRSLDRAALSLDAAAWSGHCQELDVLRAALEQQLDCAFELRGQCAAAGAP